MPSPPDPNAEMRRIVAKGLLDFAGESWTSLRKIARSKSLSKEQREQIEELIDRYESGLAKRKEKIKAIPHMAEERAGTQAREHPESVAGAAGLRPGQAAGQASVEQPNMVRFSAADIEYKGGDVFHIKWDVRTPPPIDHFEVQYAIAQPDTKAAGVLKGFFKSVKSAVSARKWKEPPIQVPLTDWESHEKSWEGALAGAGQNEIVVIRIGSVNGFIAAGGRKVWSEPVEFRVPTAPGAVGTAPTAKEEMRNIEKLSATVRTGDDAIELARKALGKLYLLNAVTSNNLQDFQPRTPSAEQPANYHEIVMEAGNLLQESAAKLHDFADMLDKIQFDQLTPIDQQNYSEFVRVAIDLSANLQQMTLALSQLR